MELTGRIRTDLALFLHFHNSAARSDQSTRAYLPSTYVMTQDITPSMLVLPTHTRPRRCKTLWMDEGEAQPSGWVGKFFMNFLGRTEMSDVQKVHYNLQPLKTNLHFKNFFTILHLLKFNYKKSTLIVNLQLSGTNQAKYIYNK